MSGAVPSGTIPGAAPFSEWGVTLDGAIATCVEAAGLILEHIYNGVGLTNANDQAAAQSLIASGQADPRGATNNYAESGLLAGAGIPNSVSAFSLSGLNQALSQGKPVLVGLTNAQALVDQLTGTMYDLGVQGHGITVVGQNAQGYVVADPNTPGTSFVEYTGANLQQAGADTMLVPNSAPPGGGGNAGGLGGFIQQVIQDIGGYTASGPLQQGASQAGPAVGQAVNSAGGLAGQLAQLVTGAGERVGLFLLALLVLGFGLYILFAPQLRDAAAQGTRAAETAAAISAA